MMPSGKVASIDAVCTGEPRHALEGARVLGGGIKKPCIYQFYACKAKY